jgi:hypothetical protein
MKMTEIERMVHQGTQLREMADFLSDPKSKLSDVVICFQKDDGSFGYQLLDGSSMPTVRGLLASVLDQVQYMIDEMLCPIEGEISDNMD